MAGAVFRQDQSPPGFPGPAEGVDPVDAMIEQRTGGDRHRPTTPSPRIHRLRAKQGEFGAFLQLAAQLGATWDHTLKSYQLWAEHVAPVFKGANASRQASYDHTVANAPELMGKAMQAAGAMIQKHAAEQLAKASK